MDTTWRWKIWGIVGSILLGIYALIPTFFSLPSMRQELELNNKPVPWYFDLLPEKGLNLGLDLRGGVYVEMDILVDEGIQTKIDLKMQDILRDLKTRDIIPDSFGQDKDLQYVEFAFKSNEDLLTAKKIMQEGHGDFLARETRLDGETPSLRYSLQADYLDNLRKDIIAQAVQAVRNRIDRYGLAEPTVQRQGESRLVVELPGVKDTARALKIVKQAGKLEFKLVNNSLGAVEMGNLIAKAREANNLQAGYSAEDVKKLNEALAKQLPEGTEVAFELLRDDKGNIIPANVTPYLLNKTVHVTGDMLKNAQVQVDPRNSRPFVSLTFNAIGAKNFAELTKEHSNPEGRLNPEKREYLAILLDGNVASAPWLKEPILNGQCQIELGGGLDRQATLKEARDLTLVLQEGALPASLKEATKTVIGPSLGADSIQKSLKSLLIGGALVILFMVFYYKLSGLLANFALLVNSLFTFALLAMFQATLTLPGMAGIILTVGMAVDANILIFERIREELKDGQQPKAALGAGYSNAVRTIMDSNLTTIIAGIILYQFGTGPIRGFAVTLMIGLICNMFTAVIMTRTIYEFFITKLKVKTISI